MKRHWMISGAVVVVLVVGMVLAGTALAKGPVGDGDGVRAPIGGAYGPAHGFVDADGDGINDCYLTGDCGAAGSGAGYGYRSAQGGNGDMLQTRLQQQACDDECTQDCSGDQFQTRSRDGSAFGQGNASAGAGSVMGSNAGLRRQNRH